MSEPIRQPTAPNPWVYPRRPSSQSPQLGEFLPWEESEQEAQQELSEDVEREALLKRPYFDRRPDWRLIYLFGSLRHKYVWAVAILFEVGVKSFHVEAEQSAVGSYIEASFAGL